MKLRIQGNSLRLRLSQSEVAALHQQGAVEETVQFKGGVRLVYRIQMRAGPGSTEANLAHDTITVTVPAAAVEAWATSDEVGLRSNDGLLSIAIEKDFRCLTRSAEDEPDAFPRPGQHTKAD